VAVFLRRGVVGGAEEPGFIEKLGMAGRSVKLALMRIVAHVQRTYADQRGNGRIAKW
jgi:hypothetical protein